MPLRPEQTPMQRMAALYEQHAGDQTMRLVLGEYAACITQLERSAMTLAVLGEIKLAEAIYSRIRDLLRQAERCARPKEIHGTEDERTTHLAAGPK